MSSSQQRLILIAGSLVIIGLGAILILSAVTGGRPIAPATATTPAAASSAASAEIPYPEIVRVSLGQSKAAYDLKQATFLDVRDAESYGNGHVPGAISIPLTELETRLKELDPNAWILTYCT